MGTFLTGVMTETKASTKNMANRKGSVDHLLNSSSQQQFDSPSPQSAGMMSFNFFVTQVPIDQLVIHAHGTSQAVTTQQKNRAAWKIKMELDRKIQDKQKKEKLDAVLKRQQHDQKRNVKELKKAHDEKMDKAQMFMKKQAKHERLQQLETYRKIEQDALMRDEKVKQANAIRLDEIKKNQEKARAKHERVKNWQ